MFTEPENTACFTCVHVLEDNQPVVLVTHDNDDGSWQFLCGADTHEVSDARVVALIEMVKMDESLNVLFDMRMGFEAIRKTKEEHWELFKTNI